MVLAGFVGGCRWFWVVLGGFGWFRVLVTTDKNVTNTPRTETSAATERWKISFVKSAIYNISVLCCFKRRNIENFFVSSLFLDSISVEFNKKAESVIEQFEHAAMHDTWELKRNNE